MSSRDLKIYFFLCCGYDPQCRHDAKSNHNHSRIWYSLRRNKTISNDSQCRGLAIRYAIVVNFRYVDIRPDLTAAVITFAIRYVDMRPDLTTVFANPHAEMRPDTSTIVLFLVQQCLPIEFSGLSY